VFPFLGEKVPSFLAMCNMNDPSIGEGVTPFGPAGSGPWESDSLRDSRITVYQLSSSLHH
jgi:hypothetical protein